MRDRQKSQTYSNKGLEAGGSAGLVIRAMQTSTQIGDTLALPVLRRELVDNLLEGVQRAEGVITRKMVLSLSSAARNADRSIVVANTDVVLPQGIAGFLWQR